MRTFGSISRASISTPTNRNLFIDLIAREGSAEAQLLPNVTEEDMRRYPEEGVSSLHDRNTTESDRIVERIENWLDHHNESKELLRDWQECDSSDIIKPRRRRSIVQHDTPALKHIETKMVLLQSLGNAGKQRSLRHILSYMKPNVGVTAWLRKTAHHKLYY
ncbi:hypothetical protein DPMN_125661 [Dreissena polymorpha]|uniref:Uncharacterized protein n=1 Tax=Dreissena polymorpha TaxID=45954 RepID=A0A9D4GVP6_DREPO|nr:hypothetical protein DPMN_125661 [Dreissena polymorpha]